jgi:hypothetical protein
LIAAHFDLPVVDASVGQQERSHLFGITGHSSIPPHKFAVDTDYFGLSIPAQLAQLPDQRSTYPARTDSQTSIYVSCNSHQDRAPEFRTRNLIKPQTVGVQMNNEDIDVLIENQPLKAEFATRGLDLDQVFRPILDDG